LAGLIKISAVINIVFFLMHEFDAFHRGEWKMFPLLNRLSEKTQYSVFLYAHIPICLLVFYYLKTVFESGNFALFVFINSFGFLHLLLHLAALRWKTNVFTGFASLLFITATGLTGLINLLLSGYYFIPGS